MKLIRVSDEIREEVLNGYLKIVDAFYIKYQNIPPMDRPYIEQNISNMIIRIQICSIDELLKLKSTIQHCANANTLMI